MGEIEPAGHRADDRHDDVADQRTDDGAEGGTDDDADGEVDDVAAHGEFLEFFEHRSLPIDDALSSAPTQRKNRSAAGRPAQLIRPAWTMASRTAICAFSVAGT